MGQLTRAQIVSAGLQIAGDTSLTTHANTWLNAALQGLYRDWPWPFLIKRQTGFSWAAGVTSKTFGAGAGGESLQVSRIYDPIWLYSSDYRTKARARVGMFPPVALDQAGIDNPATNVGQPNLFQLRQSNTVIGQFVMVPDRIPEKDYLLNFDYLFVPADISDNSTVPIYPNDETLIQVVKGRAAVHMAAPEEKAQVDAAERSLLAPMAAQDRVRYGSSEGINEDQILDPNTFR